MLCLYVIIDKKKKGKAVSSNANLWNTASPTHVYDNIIL